MTRTDWIVYKVSVLCVVCSLFCDMTYELYVGSRRSQEEEETLTSQVARLEREKTAETFKGNKQKLQTHVLMLQRLELMLQRAKRRKENGQFWLFDATKHNTQKVLMYVSYSFNYTQTFLIRAIWDRGVPVFQNVRIKERGNAR